MENNSGTRAVFVNAGEQRITLIPCKGNWEHQKNKPQDGIKKANLWFNAPAGAREFVLQALAKVTKVDENGEVKIVSSNVIIWEMPENLMVAKKAANGQWYYTVTITDEDLQNWTDMIIENVKPRGAVSEKNQPVIDNAKAKLNEKLARLGITEGSNNDDDDEEFSF
jgi:hypothetical protein